MRNIKIELDSKVRQQWLNMTKVEIICVMPSLILLSVMDLRLSR